MPAVHRAGTYAPGGALSGDHDGTVDADIDGIMDGDGGTGGAMTADAMGNDFGGDGTGGVGDDAGLEDAVIMEADDGAACVAGDGTCTQGATSDGNGPGGRGGGFFSNQVDPDSGNTFDVAAPTDPATGNGAVGIGAAGASAVAAALAAAWIAAM